MNRKMCKKCEIEKWGKCSGELFRQIETKKTYIDQYGNIWISER